jgi:hypothetical protein
MDTSINDEGEQGAFYPHLLIEDAFSFFWLVWFTRMELGGGNGGIGFCVNDLSSPF